MQQPSYKKTYGSPERSEQLREIVLHPEHMDDSALWQAFRSGDEKALITIFDRFTQSLYNYGYKITADKELVKDAIQELFIEIWQSRERLSNTDSIKYYLFKSLRRKIVRIKSKAVNRLFRGLSQHDENTEITPSAEFIMISEQAVAEQTQKLHALLDTLSRRQKEAMYLRYFDELDCDQIAAIMELSQQAVYNLIHHSLLKLKKHTDSHSLDY